MQLSPGHFASLPNPRPAKRPAQSLTSTPALEGSPSSQKIGTVLVLCVKVVLFATLFDHNTPLLVVVKAVLLLTLVDFVVLLVLLQVLVALVLLQVRVRDERMAGSSWNSSEAMHLPASKRLRKVQLGFASQALAFWMYKLQS